MTNYLMRTNVIAKYLNEYELDVRHQATTKEQITLFIVTKKKTKYLHVKFDDGKLCNMNET